MAVDPNLGNGQAATNPPVNAFAITTSDSVDLTIYTRSIWVGVGGDIQVTYVGDTAGTSVVLKNAPSGARLSGRFKRVWATSTTATNLIGEY